MWKIPGSPPPYFHCCCAGGEPGIEASTLPFEVQRRIKVFTLFCSLYKSNVPLITVTIPLVIEDRLVEDSGISDYILEGDTSPHLDPTGCSSSVTLRQEMYSKFTTTCIVFWCDVQSHHGGRVWALECSSTPSTACSDNVPTQLIILCYHCYLQVTCAVQMVFIHDGRTKNLHY